MNLCLLYQSRSNVSIIDCFFRLSESNRCLWKFNEIAPDKENSGLKAIRARFEIANGPGSQGTIAAQFNCEGTTLSGIDFELIGPGYRLSLVKKRFVSGNYTSQRSGDLHITNEL